MNFASNLPEQPTRYESKIYGNLNHTKHFFKSLLYLTKKLFML